MAIFKKQYKALIGSGSLKGFYDDVVYWEIAKNNNKFFVTFMEGEYAIPNNLQESIGTMEISFPHTSLGFDDSTGSFTTGFNRNSAKAEAFLQNIESSSIGTTILSSSGYNGFIPVTELSGIRNFQTTLTSSGFVSRTYDYEIHDTALGTTTTSIDYKASYFYPFSSHQLAVLRDEPTLIVNIDKESELSDGLGDFGFVVVPQNCHAKVRNNIEFYLEKAGLIDKTTEDKAPPRGL